MQNIMKTMKRIAAIGIGAVMAGATMGAAFASLDSYPAPFIKDNKLNGVIVVGAAAAPADVIGATDIAATLAQQVSVTPSETTTSISGGKEYDVPLGVALNTKFPSTMTSTDLSGFYDGSVTLENGDSSNSYNVKDTLTLGSGMKITTGLAEGSTSKEWGKDIWLTTNTTGQIQYNFVFKSGLKAANYLTNATSDDPVEITFLGKTLDITGASANGITAQVGEAHYLTYGESVTVDGKTVTLVNVGSNGACVVSVDGAQGTIKEGTQSKVGGLRFSIKSTFTSDTPSERAADLMIGKDVSKSYNDGDPYIGEPTTDYNWEWNLKNLDTANPTIGIKYSKTLLNPSSTNKPIKSGGIASPDGSYFKINLGEPTTKSYKDYNFNGLGIVDLYAGAGNNTVDVNAAYGMEITAAGGGKNGFQTAGNSQYTDKIFLYGAQVGGNEVVKVYWGNPDEGNHYQPTGVSITQGDADVTIATIQTPDTSAGLPLKLAIDGAGSAIAVYVDGQQDIIQGVALKDNTIKYLGSQVGTATAGDLWVDATDISTLDADGRTKDGIVIEQIKDNGDSDTLRLSIPSKVGTDFAVRTTVSSEGTTTSVNNTGVSGTLSGVTVAKLDTEIVDPKAQNMILVGDAAVNRLSAQVMGLNYPTYGSDPAFKAAMHYGAGQGTIKAVANAFGGSNWAWIVAGWDAQNTRDAATVLKDYSLYKAQMKGDQVIVTNNNGVLTLSQPQVATNTTT